MPGAGGFCESFAVTPLPPVVPDYELLRRIGRGSYGDVWLARSITGQWRAVKVVQRERFDSDRPFEREFLGIQQFESISHRHPSQLRILHVGRNVGAGFFYYVMELADPVGAANTTTGPFDWQNYSPRTLRADLEQRGRLTGPEVLTLAEPLTEALGHLHAEGLIHRDIKPSNIIFVEGRPKLADIGLITAAQASQTFVGTEGFVPPEGPGSVAADIYALGKVLYEAATGRDRTDFPSLPENLERLPDRTLLMELNEIWLRACDRDPLRRHRGADALRDDLLLLSAGRSMRRWRRAERQLRLVTRAGLVVTLLALVATGLGIRANQQKLRAIRAEQELTTRFVGQQLALARATRLTGLPGQRLRALEILAEAARRTNSLALRNEAAAALALPDVEAVRSFASARQRWVFDRRLERYATNDSRGQIHVRSASDHRPLSFLPEHRPAGEFAVRYGLHGHGFSPDGLAYAASYTNHDFLIWSLAGQPSFEQSVANDLPALERLPVNSRPTTFRLPWGARGAASVPGTRWFAADAADGALHFFDLDGSEKLRMLTGVSRVADVAFAPDGRRFAQRMSEEVMIRSVETGATNLVWSTGGPVSGMVWHPDGVQLVTWSHDRLLKIWNAESGTAAGILAGHEAAVTGAAFDARGQWLVTTSWDSQTILWGVARQQPALRLADAGNELRMHPEAARLGFQSWRDDQWKLFDLTPASEMVWLESHPRSALREGNRDLWRVVFLDNGLLVGVSNHGLNFWRLDEPGFGEFLPATVRHDLAAGSEGGLLTVDGRAVRRWQPAWDGREQTLSAKPPVRVTPIGVGSVISFSASRGGQRLAVKNDRGELHLQSATQPEDWSLVTRQPVAFCSLDAAGQRLAAAYTDGGFEIWDTAGARSLVKEGSPSLNNGGLSPDGRWWVAGSPSLLRVWSVDTGQVVLERPRQVAAGCNFAWSADNRWLLVNDTEAQATLLEVGSWRELIDLPAPTMMRSPAFSADGQWLALPGEKSGAQLWNLTRLRERLRALGLDWN